MGILDLIGHKYPFTDFHELNLDWCITAILQLQKAFEDFSAGNKLTFADPLQHDLTKTYAKNTIVVDPVSGSAYLSLDTVPKGVQLDNTDYWLPVFDFAGYVTRANQNFTDNYFTGTDRTPIPLIVGDWVVLDDVLYKVTVAMAADDLFIIGTNIAHFTVEQFLKDFITTVNNTLAAYSLTIQQYKDDIDASEALFTSQLQAQFDQVLAGITVDSEVINARVEYDGSEALTLGNAITQQASRLSNRIDDIATLFDANYDVTNEAVSNSDGTISAAKQRLITPIIPLKNTISISISGDYEFAMVFYSNGVWQSGPSSYTTSFSIPINSSLLTNYDGFRLQIRRSDFRANALNALDIKGRLTTVGFDVPLVYNEDVQPTFIEDLGILPQIKELYMLDNSYKPYNITANSTQFRLNFKDANDVSMVNGVNVAPEYYSDKIQTLVDTATCEVIGYAIIHYTGTDYANSTVTPWNLSSAAYDLDQSPTIKEYLSREENLVLIGDSLFGYYQENVAAAFLRSMTDKKVFNCAFGGCRMAWRTNDGSADYDNFSFSNVIDAIVAGDYSALIANKGLNGAFPYRIADLKEIDWTKPTKILVGYVNNDITGGNLIGDHWSDGDVLADFDRTTVLGAFNYGITKFLTDKPAVNVIEFTSAWRRMGSPAVAPYEYVNSAGLTAPEYDEAIKDNASRLGIAIYDYFNLGGRNAFNASVYQQDASHYNAEGFKMLAEIISSIVDSFIQ